MSNRFIRKRVLFVINSLAGGGAERVLLELIGASHRFANDYDFSLALLDDEKREYTPPKWLKIHQLDSRRGLIRSTRELHRLLRTLRPDVSLSFLTRANFASVVGARMLGHRAIISERVNTSGHFLRGPSAAVSKLLVRLIYPAADKVIAVSEGIAEDLVTNFKVPRDKLLTIPNPVDMNRIIAASAEISERKFDYPFAVAVSRLTNTKNVMLLVEALATSGLALPLVILGQGPEYETIQNRVHALGLNQQVQMLGFVPNPYPIMASATCYLSGSNAEGFPNGLVEALALGKSVVATNCPSGPSEILFNRRREEITGLHVGDIGILVPQNDIKAMANAIRLAVDEERVVASTIAGPRRASDFGVETATNQYWQAIESVVK